MSASKESAQRKTYIERRSIDYIPESERHGRLLSQFTLWFGANLQVTAVVTGRSQTCETAPIIDQTNGDCPCASFHGW